MQRRRDLGVGAPGGQQIQHLALAGGEPVAAETWVLVMLPVSALASAEVGSFVGAAHLLVGYTLLGVILAARPELTVARDR